VSAKPYCLVATCPPPSRHLFVARCVLFAVITFRVDVRIRLVASTWIAAARSVPLQLSIAAAVHDSC
jgi:hypothetical protein